MYLWASYDKKMWQKFFFFILKINEELDPDPETDPLVRGTDPGIRIRTKMSRNPNTGFSIIKVSLLSNCRFIKKIDESTPYLPYPKVGIKSLIRYQLP